MKYIKAFIWTNAFLFVLTLAGCSNGQPCYQCSSFNGNFKAVKTGDTISFAAVTKPAINDSVTHYISLGYTIDTVNCNYELLDGGDYYCGKSNYTAAIAAGDTCWLAKE